MSPDNSTPNTTKLCPTCGTRLGINATRCSVCGSSLSPSASAASANAVTGPRIPTVTLSLPVLFGLGVLLLIIGAGAVYGALNTLRGDEPVASVAATITDTPGPTPTITVTPTDTPTPTLEPTWTPEPPLTYKVASGDTCLGIALAFGVSVNSIVQLNELSVDCSPLSLGQELKIPRPTPTPSPAPTNTLNPTEIAKQECETFEYIVKDNDTLGGIAGNYAVSVASVRVFNNLPNDIVWVGQKLVIPLCEQMLETPTPTAIPPYRAPNLLLPADGASFTNPSEAITLQWDAVGTLRQNELYAVTIEDVTDGDTRKWVDYVPDTKFTLPESYRATEDKPHVYRWTVMTVRQTGTDKDSGLPVYEPAGAVSSQRVFSWMGGASAPPTSAP
jgi:LysM repeat protein